MGDNPDVFTYRFSKPDHNNISYIHIEIYGLNIYVSLQPSNAAKPFDLGFMLAQSGIRTTIEFGDEKYEFNEDQQGNAE